MPYGKFYNNRRYLTGSDNPLFGKRRSPEAIAKISNENNYGWKGNNVSYGHLHKYMRKQIPKPDICPICNIREVKDLTNVTGVYTKDPNNWQWQCRKCHMLLDGRMKNLRNQNG